MVDTWTRTDRASMKKTRTGGTSKSPAEAGAEEKEKRHLDYRYRLHNLWSL